MFTVLTEPEVTESKVTEDKIFESVNTVDGYIIQLGVFSNAEGANSLLDKYKNLANSAYIKEVNNKNNQTVYRVILGEFLTKEKAIQYANRFSLNSNEYLIKKEQVVIPSEKVTVIANGLNNVVAENIINNITPINKSPINTVEGEWVIQFNASSLEFNTDILKAYSKVDSLFTAQKVANSTGQLWYCLISEGYQTKLQAVNELKRLSLDGWVTKSNTYSQITKVDKR